MIHSVLYKKYYPFKSTNVYSLTSYERNILKEYINHYPGRISNAMINARKNGVDVDGWDRRKWLESFFLPSTGLVNVLIILQEQCNELILKIEAALPLTEVDITNLNRVLYANKYCRLISFFYCPVLHSYPLVPWEFEPEGYVIKERKKK